VIGIIGAGNMGRALARGWGEPVLATDSGSGRAAALVAELGGEALTDNRELIARADIVVLAHRPEQLASIGQGARAAGKMVVSVLGPCPVAAIRAAYREATVVRAMPNTPVEVRRGVTAIAEGGEAGIPLFERVGKVYVVPEPQMSLATASTGVMPAYIALLAEAAIDASVCYGMPYSVATEVFLETLAGTAALLQARGGNTLLARREVGSPGESTVRGLAALERAGVRTAFNDAMRAVLERLSLPYEGAPVLGTEGSAGARS
jgi:pyrroline-5-carboxylate reductase